MEKRWVHLRLKEVSQKTGYSFEYGEAILDITNPMFFNFASSVSMRLMALMLKQVHNMK